MAKVDLNKFSEKFKDDGYNLLNELEGKLLELEKDTLDHELTEAVFRSMHTLKGVGGMFGYNVVSEYTHFLEEIYDRIRKGELTLSRTIFNVTFDSIDHIRNLLNDRDVKDPALVQRHHELTARIEEIIRETQQDIARFSMPEARKRLLEDAAPNIWYIHFRCSEELFFRGVNIVYLFEDLSKIGKFCIDRVETLDYPGKNPSEEVWGIYLRTKVSYSEIEEVFVFIRDYVKIIKVTDIDLFNPESVVHLPAEASSPDQSIAGVAARYAQKNNGVPE